MITNSCHKMCLAVSLGGPSFFKQQYMQMMTEPPQSLPSVCGFYAIFAVFHFLKFRQEEITRVHNINAPSFKNG